MVVTLQPCSHLQIPPPPLAEDKSPVRVPQCSPVLHSISTNISNGLRDQPYQYRGGGGGGRPHPGRVGGRHGRLQELRDWGAGSHHLPQGILLTFR